MVKLIGKDPSTNTPSESKSSVRLIGHESETEVEDKVLTDVIDARSPLRSDARAIQSFIEDPAESNIISQIANSSPQDVVVPDFRQAIPAGESFARTALRTPFPTLLAEDISNRVLGLDSPVTTGIAKFNQELPFGLGDEFQAGLDTAAELFSGNLQNDPEKNFFEDLKESFKFHKAAKRLQLDRQAQRNPKSALLGELTAFLPKLGLLRGSPGSGKLIGSSAALGAAEGFGRSEHGVADDPIQLAKDVATTASIAGALGGAGGLAKGASKLLKPKTLNDVAGYFRVAGGGDAAKAGKVIAGKPGELPPQIRGFQLSKNEGLLNIENNFVVQPETTRLPSISDIIKGPKTAFSKTATSLKEKGRRLVSTKSRLDYDQLRGDLNNALSKKRAAKLDILDKHLRDQTYKIEDVYGLTKGKASSVIDDVLALEDDIIRSGSGSPEQLAAVRQLRIDFSKQNLTPRQIEEINRNLFSVGKRGIGKSLPETSPMKKILDTRAKGENFLKREIAKKSKGAADSYDEISRQTFQQASFSEAADEGAAIDLLEQGRNPRFEKGIVSQALQNQGAGSVGGTNISIPQILGAGFRVAEATAGRALSGVSKLLGIPAINAKLATIFKSYDGKKIYSSKDKELMFLYIRRSKASPREKAKAIAAMFEDGSVDSKYVPKSVLKSAEDKLNELEI